MTTPAPLNGCHNRKPYRQVIRLRDHHGREVAAWPHAMTTDCQYTRSDLGQADQRCLGCRWRQEPAHG